VFPVDVGKITFDHDIDSKRIIDAIHEPDDVGAIIRIHFETERAIDYTLKKLTSGRYESEKSRWKFEQKVEILQLLGTPRKWLYPIKTLNKHRNKFAHEGKTSIETQEFLDLFRQVKAIAPNIGEGSIITIEKENVTSKPLENFRTKEKYIILIAMVCSFICAIPYMGEKSENG